jgi:hypothetical protein
VIRRAADAGDIHAVPRVLRSRPDGAAAIVIVILVPLNVIDAKVPHASLVVGPVGAALPLTRNAFRDSRYHMDWGSALPTAFVLIPVGTVPPAFRRLYCFFALLL